MMAETMLYGGIEGGGTKFVCAVGSGPENIDIEPGSPTYGFITTTPKPHWANTDILGLLREKLKIPIVMDMDVAAAAMGEFKWGASKGLDPSLYLTIGTGIGGGFIVGGRPFRGIVSLEMGHIRIPRSLELDPFPGACPYHGDCFEGVASGPAIQARFGRRAETIPDEDPFWAVEADYIAYALVNYIFTFAPRKIVLGGGVMQKSFLFGQIWKKVGELLNNYLNHEMLINNIEMYIVPPLLGSRSGVLGSIALAIRADLENEA